MTTKQQPKKYLPVLTKKKGFFARNTELLAILLFALLLRFCYLYSSVIPFSFDHGKDSLAVLHMIQTGSPKLIGPWTSIPGLFFGPGWYYLLAPALALAQGNPMAPVYALAAIVLLQVFLAYRYFGKYEAMIIATAELWMMFSRSAWNPFPMPLVTLVLLILIRKLQRQSTQSKYPTWLLVGLLTFTAALGFHFSTAFAVFYLFILPVWFLKNSLHKKLGNWIAAVGGFVVPFIPQLLFEVRHNFVEARAVLSYFSSSIEHVEPLAKLSQVLSVTFGELKLGFMPDLPANTPAIWLQIVTYIVIALLAYALFSAMKRRKPFPLGFEIVTYFFIPLIGLIFLHFNLWYVWALAPIPVIIIGYLLRQSPRWVGIAFMSLLILGSLLRVTYFITTEQQVMKKSRAFLPIKLEAIDWIYQHSNNEPFASYHYESDIYDYPYQYIYWWLAIYRGKQLPTEFSYKPGEWSYSTEKPELLATYQKRFGAETKQPKRIFYIVEQAENSEFLDSWWNEQKHGAFIDIATLSAELTVYEAEVAK